ncbi:MAG: hypothetical protein OWQ48_02360 [Desulfurococcus sp.]|nr:hypothetical protein [Desulfurococcus sp.]
MSSIPSRKRGKRKKEEKEEPKVKDKGKSRKSVSKRPARVFDTSRLVEEVLDQVYATLGLDALDVDREVALRIAREIAELAASGYTSKPSLDALLKKIQRNKAVLNELIASRILELVEKPSLRTLEFVIANGGKAIVRDISRLYKLAREQGRDDLIDALRAVWDKHGVKGLVKCPRCGFNSISPDYSCVVCGYVVSEKYVREELGFNEKFKEYLKTASVAELRTILEARLVLADQKWVYPPRGLSLRGGEALYPIHLTRSDVDLIVNEINSRDIRV